MPSATWKATNWLRNEPVPESGWQGIRFQWGKDAQLGLFILLTLGLFRLLLIAIFGDRMGPDAHAGEILAVVGNGLRYDLSTTAIWLLPSFLAGLVCGLLPIGRALVRLRLFIGRLFVWVSIPLFGADIVYFQEYGDQFNQHLFGIVHDDTTAILITIWKSYHPLLYLGAVAPLLWLGDRAVRAWLAWSPAALRARAGRAPWRNFGKGLAMLLLFTAAARGGTLWGEPIRLKHAFISRDVFLNRVVLNPHTALRETLDAKWRRSGGGGLAALWPQGDIRHALNAFNGRGGGPDLDSALTVAAHGGRPPPRHIFVLLIESHDGWPLLPAYRSLGFSPQLAALAEEGLYFPNFLPVASGTVGAMHALMVDMPDIGLDINYETSALKPFPTSAAATFKQLGYRTRFFYGGFLSWQRLDTYAQAQGFDELYGGGEMGAGERTNEWGVRDAALYDFVMRTVQDDTPSFNFILTTSNHPPYDLDLAAEGFPFGTLPKPLAATKAETLKILGHLWYADREAGRFVREMERRLKAPLFAVTGDHTTRLQIRFPGDSQFEQVAVPLVLYGPQVLGERRGQLATAGNHLDILPTLYELAAPQGFSYRALGEDLLRKPSPSWAHGFELVAGEGALASADPIPQLYRVPGVEPPAAGPEHARAVERFRAARALAWYRVRQGSALP